MKNLLSLTVALALVLSLAACGGPASPSASPTPTTRPSPTASPSPTPRPTTKPKPTPEPTPEPTPALSAEELTSDNISNTVTNLIKDVIPADDLLVEVAFQERDLVIALDMHADRYDNHVDIQAQIRVEAITETILQYDQLDEYWDTIIVKIAKFPVLSFGKSDVRQGSIEGVSFRFIKVPSGYSILDPTPEELEAEKAAFASTCYSYNYKDVARDPDAHEGLPARFKGEVVQVMEGGDYNLYRVNVTLGNYGIWSDTIMVGYVPQKGEPRILEEDIVEIYGTLSGLYTYETVMGNSLSIPAIAARYMDLVG